MHNIALDCASREITKAIGPLERSLGMKVELLTKDATTMRNTLAKVQEMQ